MTRSTTTRVAYCAGLLALFVSTGCQQGRGPIADFRHSRARHESNRGEQLLAQGQYPGAVQAFERALSHDRTSAPAHAGMGQVRELEGDLEAAVKHYQEAMKAAPERSDYAVALGDALRKSAVTSMQRAQLLDAAIRAYRHALVIDKRNHYAAMGLGMCHRLTGRIDQAIEAYMQAKKMNPTSSDAHALLASLYESQSQHEKAMAEYRTALRIDPENARLHNAVAALNLRMTSGGGAQATLARQRALAHYRKSLDINPDQPHVERRIVEIDPTSRTAVTAAPREIE